MRGIGHIIAVLFALVVSGFLMWPAMSDEAPVIRHKRIHVCPGPRCGPYTVCGVRCRVVCPDGYSCYPLYGAYGPYGGTRFWGSYTFTGWGYR